MTPREFHYWFIGFCEAIDSVPTESQWRRICEQVQRLAGEPQTKPLPEGWRPRDLVSPHVPMGIPNEGWKPPTARLDDVPLPRIKTG